MHAATRACLVARVLHRPDPASVRSSTDGTCVAREARPQCVLPRRHRRHIPHCITTPPCMRRPLHRQSAIDGPGPPGNVIAAVRGEKERRGKPRQLFRRPSILAPDKRHQNDPFSHLFVHNGRGRLVESSGRERTFSGSGEVPDSGVSSGRGITLSASSAFVLFSGLPPGACGLSCSSGTAGWSAITVSSLTLRVLSASRRLIARLG